MSNLEEKIKEKVMDAINAGSGGRLIIAKTEKNPVADLIIERRGNYREKPKQLKIISFERPVDGVFTKDLMAENIQADKSLVLVFVYFDEVLQKIEDTIWIIPSLKFQNISNNGTFQSSVHGIDDYTPFLAKIDELGKLLMAGV